MTTFEIIILIALYLFAFGYMAKSFGIGDEHWEVRLLIIIAAATLGIIYFPLVLAEDIWNRLNKDE